MVGSTVRSIVDGRLNDWLAARPTRQPQPSQDPVLSEATVRSFSVANGDGIVDCRCRNDRFRHIHDRSFDRGLLLRRDDISVLDHDRRESIRAPHARGFRLLSASASAARVSMVRAVCKHDPSPVDTDNTVPSGTIHAWTTAAPPSNPTWSPWSTIGAVAMTCSVPRVVFTP